jgi:hypothetical protein
VTARTAAPPAGRTVRLAAILTALFLVNLAVYAAGRALGGTFTYQQHGTAVRVDPLAIAIMSLAPLATGLMLVAVLSRRWPAVIRVARVAAPALAVVTIAVMTLPAGFDATSAASLAVMHLTTIPAALLALATFPSR